MFYHFLCSYDYLPFAFINSFQRLGSLPMITVWPTLLPHLITWTTAYSLTIWPGLPLSIATLTKAPHLIRPQLSCFSLTGVAITTTPSRSTQRSRFLTLLLYLILNYLRPLAEPSVVRFLACYRAMLAAENRIDWPIPFLPMTISPIP